MTLQPGDYMRTSRGWVRCTRVDHGVPSGVLEPPADDAGIEGAGRFDPVVWDRAVMIGGFLLAFPAGIDPASLGGWRPVPPAAGFTFRLS